MFWLNGRCYSNATLLLFVVVLVAFLFNLLALDSGVSVIHSVSRKCVL